MSLQFLHETGITDAGFLYLEEPSNPVYVSVEGKKVTGEGIRLLRKALPGCEIISDSPPE